ncbi:MAG: coiled-coil [Microgenomates group bacterium GW2011_GWC1_39_12]|nr:MAG: coiled-coil [Microgenomates group bacterium GW2011_GWC1_39_12]
MKIHNPSLDEQETRIEQALEAGEYMPSIDVKQTRKFFESAAKQFQELKKSRRITIRVNQGDLLKVKAKAKKSNIPYQTLLNVLISQFADGRRAVQI